MPKLARVRFVSIGHPNARMQDLTLNLSDQAGVPSDSTIWLRNGGGKSSILSLFFALLRPNLRDFLGSKADAKQRSLKDYILTNDRSVVAAEWTLDLQGLPLETAADTMPRFLTGVFYEYAGGNRESLRRLYFSARVSDAVEETQLPTLPIDMDMPDGNRVRRTMMSFKQTWHGLRDAHPSLQFFCTENQSEWSERLQSAGLDPGLFGYQLVMNSREGGADELFRFNSPDDFVDFLLELTVDPSRADGITENLKTFRDQLQRRKHEFLPDLTLSTGLIERLSPLVELHTRRIQTAEEADRLIRLHRQIKGSIALNTQGYLEQEARLAAEVAALRNAWRESETQMHHNRGLAAAVSLKLAERDLERNRLLVEELTESVEQAQREKILWQAAYPYRNYAIARKDIEAYQEQLKGTSSQRAPLQEKLAQTAGDYVAALKAQIATLEAERENIRRQCDAQELEASKLDVEAGKLEREAFACESESKSYEKNLAERQAKFESLIKLDILQNDETPAQALTRIEDAQKKRRAKLRSIERNREGNAALQDDCERQTIALQRSVAERQAELKVLERDFQKGEDARNRIETDAQFLSLLDLEHIDLDDVSDDTASLLTRRAGELQERVARLRTEAASLDRARVHIAEHGLMPPSVEVETLLTLLGPNAKSGWSYISEDLTCDEDEKERLVRALPAVAQGIIVPEREFESARRLIEANPGAIPPVPVVIATPSALRPDNAPAPHINIKCYVAGPKDHAWFNTLDAQKTLQTLEARLEDIQKDIRDNDQRRDTFYHAANRFRSFRTQYPRGWFATTKARIAQLRVLYEDDQARLDMQNDEKNRLIAAQRADERDTTRLNNEILGQERACERLREFVSEIDTSVEIWQSSAIQKRAQSQERQEQAEGMRSKAREIRENARVLQRSAEPVASRISLLESEIGRVKFADHDVQPKQGDIEELRSTYTRLLDQFQREYTDNELASLLEQTEKQAKKDLQQAKQLIRNTTLTIDDVKRAVDELKNTNDLETYGERADETLREVTRKKDDAVKAQSLCEAEFTQRKSAWLGAGKPNIPPQTPIHRDSADAFLQKAEQAARQLQNIDSNIHEKERLASQSKVARDSLAKDLERLNSIQRSNAHFLNNPQKSIDFDPDATEQLPTIEPQAIGDAITELESRLEKYRQAHEGLDSSRKSAVSAIRKWLDNPQFEQLKSPLILRFKALDPESLENSAAEYRDSLNIRIRELTATLEEIEQHRNFLAKFLLNAADDGLRLLKHADSDSVVPREVPDIGGSRFLHISTKEPTAQNDRLELIQELVDTLIDETDLPTGTKLIQRAVRQIARPFNVQVLNPDPASPKRLIEITETARFSGGEQLTCAILLYCTLANVRARTRGMNRQPTSVLILDNPIGRASRTVFINMQRQFASAMGIQLIYTTAVNDLEALSILPNVVRLRNERTDLNRGHRLLEPDVDISGRLEAIRLAKAQAPAAPQVLHDDT